MTAPAVCVKCGRALGAWSDPTCPKANMHHGRGLCGPCWRACSADDTLLDYPRLTQRAEDLVENAEHVRKWHRPTKIGREHLTWRQVAQVLGVPYPTLKKARERVQTRARLAA